MPLFDTHAHLDDIKFSKDLDSILASFLGNTRNRILCVATGIESSKDCLNIAKKTPGIFHSAGIHPNSIAENPVNSIELLDSIISESKPLAIGEIGLDRFRDYSPFELQIRFFKDQIKLARKYDLPVLIHCREAWDDMFAVLESETLSNGPLKGILHSFTGSIDDAQKCLDFGLYLSFAGMITYKKNEALRNVASKCPINKMVVETDSPYLAPEPFRGKRNEPSYVANTVNTLAQITGNEVEVLKNQLWLNSNDILGLES